MIELHEPVDLRERQRQVLADCDLLARDGDLELEATTRLAAALTGFSVAAVNVLLPDVVCSLADSVRGAVDVDDAPMERDETLCHRASLVGGPVVSDDCSTDPLFADLPWVDGRIASIRRYAMAPLTVDDLVVATLCVLDQEHGDPLSAQGLQCLADLATVTSSLLQRRRNARVARTANDELVRTRAFDRALLQALPVGVAAADADRRLTHFNDTLRGWYGEQADADADLAPDDWTAAYSLFEPDGTTPLAPERIPLTRAFAEGAVSGAEYVMRPQVGVPRTISGSGSQVRDAEGHLLGAVVVLSDITEQRALEAQLRDAATHDVLTGLPNRALLVQELAAVLSEPRDHGRGSARGGVAVLYCDLDGFKGVNDGYGHAAGDAVLVAVASRLTTAVREQDLVARLGGDEFVVVCSGVEDAAAAEAIARRVGACLAAPIVVAGVEHRVGVSVGTVLSEPGDGSDSAERLLSTADAAMYARKRARRERRASALVAPAS